MNVRVSHIRVAVLRAMGDMPRTAAEIAATAGIPDRNRTSVDRAIYWAVAAGYARRTSAVRTGRGGCQPSRFVATPAAGLLLRACPPEIPVARRGIDVEVVA